MANLADIIQIQNQMEEEKKNYYSPIEEQPDFIDRTLSAIQRGATTYSGLNIGAALGAATGLGLPSILYGAYKGADLLGGGYQMTPMDIYNQQQFATGDIYGYGLGSPGLRQDPFGINTVSLYGNYNKYAEGILNTLAGKQRLTPFDLRRQSFYGDVVNKQAQEEARQLADIRQQSESSGGYSPSTGYTAETASDLAGTGGAGGVEFSSPF